MSVSSRFESRNRKSSRELIFTAWETGNLPREASGAFQKGTNDAVSPREAVSRSFRRNDLATKIERLAARRAR